MTERGKLFILSGPAGAGKGTLRKKLFEAMPDLVYSVSCTTRHIRPGEEEGRDYHFIQKDEFATLVDRGAFLEWAEVHGNYYGTRQSDVERSLEKGIDVVLEIDVQGAANVIRKMPDAVKIFITAPSLDILRDRLERRGTETPEQLMLRMKNAEIEIRCADDYDRIIVNDDLDRAAGELIKMVADRRRH